MSKNEYHTSFLEKKKNANKNKPILNCLIEHVETTTTLWDFWPNKKMYVHLLNSAEKK